MTKEYRVTIHFENGIDKSTVFGNVDDARDYMERADVIEGMGKIRWAEMEMRVGNEDWR